MTDKCISIRWLHGLSSQSDPFAHAREHGFSKIALSFPLADSETFGIDYLSATAKSIADLANRYLMNVHALIAHGRSIFDLACGQPGSILAESAISHLRFLLALAHALSDGIQDEKESDNSDSCDIPVILPAHSIVFPAGKALPKDYCYEIAFNNLYQNLSGIVPYAEDKSNFLTIENPASALLTSPLELRELIDEFNSAFIRVCFNPDNASMIAHPKSCLGILTQRTTVLHLPLSAHQNDIVGRSYRELLEISQKLCIPLVIYT